MDHSFGNQCRESKKAGSILGSLLFPSYLFFHTSDSGQIWDPRKAVFKENLTLLRARRLEKNSWRTLEVTGTNHLRSEEHTSELQSPDHLVCRLLLEKKKKTNSNVLRCRDLQHQH